MKNIFQKSIVAIEDIAKGEIIDNKMLALKKPGLGLQPSKLESIIGKKVNRDITQDTYLSEKDIVW